MQGQLKTGEKCFYDLQCPAGAFCVAKPDGTDPLDNYCSPVIQEGTPCANGSGSTCGTALTCVEGKCAPKLKKGDSCEPTSQICEGDLTCLLNKSTDKTGKCGVLRKAGEACHRWTECEGRCSSRNKKTQDGKCVSFCGSK